MEGTGSHVLADRVRQDLSCPRPRHRREGLFGVDSRRMCARRCKYHTDPCELAHGQRVSWSEKRRPPSSTAADLLCKLDLVSWISVGPGLARMQCTLTSFATLASVHDSTSTYDGGVFRG